MNNNIIQEVFDDLIELDHNIEEIKFIRRNGTKKLHEIALSLGMDASLITGNRLVIFQNNNKVEVYIPNKDARIHRDNESEPMLDDNDFEEDLVLDIRELDFSDIGNLSRIFEHVGIIHHIKMGEIGCNEAINTFDEMGVEILEIDRIKEGSKISSLFGTYTPVNKVIIHDIGNWDTDDLIKMFWGDNIEFIGNNSLRIRSDYRLDDDEYIIRRIYKKKLKGKQLIIEVTNEPYEEFRKIE